MKQRRSSFSAALIVFAGWFCLQNPSLAQIMSDTLLLPGITQMSLTRQGQIVAANDRSTIFLLDSTGKVLYQFSPRRPARIHLLEGWNGLRIFAFYRDFQEFVLLDRFLLSDENLRIDPEKTGYARLVAPALDGNLWILDERSFELKKVDSKNQNSLFSTPLDLILSGKKYELTFMREFQNQLYITDLVGNVLVFDLMGNFRKKLPLTHAAWLAFDGEELYTTENDSLAFFHPFLLRKKKVPLPESVRGATKVLISGNDLFWIKPDGLHRAMLPVEIRNR